MRFSDIVAVRWFDWVDVWLVVAVRGKRKNHMLRVKPLKRRGGRVRVRCEDKLPMGGVKQALGSLHAHIRPFPLIDDAAASDDS